MTPQPCARLHVETSERRREDENGGETVESNLEHDGKMPLLVETGVIAIKEVLDLKNHVEGSRF